MFACDSGWTSVEGSSIVLILRHSYVSYFIRSSCKHLQYPVREKLCCACLAWLGRAPSHLLRHSWMLLFCGVLNVLWGKNTEDNYCKTKITKIS